MPYSPREHPTLTPNLHTHHRFPAEIISHCVWEDFRFCLRYWDVEELMAEPRSA
jgi:transposase-like protein